MYFNPVTSYIKNFLKIYFFTKYVSEDVDLYYSENDSLFPEIWLK